MQHGMSPSESFKTVKAREAEVRRLFDLMPMGEFTPGLFLRGVGGGVQRLEVTGEDAQELVAWGVDRDRCGDGAGELSVAVVCDAGEGVGEKRSTTGGHGGARRRDWGVVAGFVREWARVLRLLVILRPWRNWQTGQIQVLVG